MSPGAVIVGEVALVLAGSTATVIGGYAIFRVMQWHAERRHERAERRVDHRAEDRLRQAQDLLAEVRETSLNAGRFDSEVRI
jgi:hypothetical protein